MLPSAPEHFGDTILFSTDDDILEAIYCYDETYDGEMENASSLRYEEELKRPTTADGDGDERPFTQAGLRTEDQQVGISAFGTLITAFLKCDMEIGGTDFCGGVKLCRRTNKAICVLKIFFISLIIHGNFLSPEVLPQFAFSG